MNSRNDNPPYGKDNDVHLNAMYILIPWETPQPLVSGKGSYILICNMCISLLKKILYMLNSGVQLYVEKVVAGTSSCVCVSL